VSVVGDTMDLVSPIRPDVGFVGRAAEIERLRLLLDSASDAQPSAVLLAGDAGVGKTRLLSEFARQARDRGVLVLVGRCVDLGAGGLAYLPFTEALSQPRRDAEAGAGEPANAAAATVRRVAGQRPVLGRLAQNSAGGLEAADPGERLSLFDAVAGILAELGREVGPVLLVIEDLHWADASTRDLLRFLLARLGSERLLVIASYRADDLHRRHPLRPLLSELLRLPGVERIELSPFDETELRDYLRRLLGAEVPEGVVRSIRARSEGNAFFAAELLEAGEGELSQLPAALADVLLTRLEQLSPDAQHVARVASVAGRRVDDELLRDASGLTAQAHDAALREAVAHQVLVPDDLGRYAFRHALMQEAVYADLLPGERVSLHAAYARSLTGAGDQAAADLAYHCLAAHDLPGALAASVRAGDESIRRLGPAEALRHYEQALQLWSAVPAAERPADRDTIDLGLSAASAANGAGELARAVSLAAQARDEAVALGDGRRVAVARGQLAGHLYADERVDEALAEARAARATLATQPPSAAAVWAAAVEVRVLGHTGDVAAARKAASQALAEARALGLAAAEVDLLTSLAVIEGARGDPGDAVAQLEEVHRQAERTQDPAAALRARYNLAVAYLDVGDLDRALRTFTMLLAQAAEAGLGSSMYGTDARRIFISTRYVVGDWEGALQVVSDGTAGLSERMARSLRGAALPVLAARDPAAAVKITEDAAAQDFWIPQAGQFVAGARAEALTWLGDTDAAVDVVQRALDWLSAAGEPWDLGGIWLSALALAALGDAAERARRANDQAAAAALEDQATIYRDDARARATKGRPRLAVLGPEGRAWLARAEAEAERVAGRADPEVWAGVVAAYEYGHRYEIARSRWRLAEALVAAGDPRAAAEQATAARETAVALGARPLREALDALARRARLDIGLGVPTGNVLTPREMEVMRLVAVGLTNRQIGQRLFISEKTASVHVSNVLAKLGASGRAEAVDIAHRRGLLGMPDDPSPTRV
jgi:ATP/maltotriose-dependent transcriptional regulator MalT